MSPAARMVFVYIACTFMNGIFGPETLLGKRMVTKRNITQAFLSKIHLHGIFNTQVIQRNYMCLKTSFEYLYFLPELL